jgi:hypothetical protein
MTQSESQELLEKEKRDALRKAETRGIPYFVLRGVVYATDGSMKSRVATTVEQTLWDALSVLG